MPLIPDVAFVEQQFRPLRIPISRDLELSGGRKIILDEVVSRLRLAIRAKSAIGARAVSIVKYPVS